MLHAESPRPGDLVFFDPNDRGNALYPAQVAIVETIATDGTFTALAHFATARPDHLEPAHARHPDRERRPTAQRPARW